MSTPASKSQRPLSPHLQVYKPQMTSIMSILHRMTGAALAVGTLMVVWWLVAAASGPEPYAVAMDFVESPLGTFMMFGWSVALFYHMCNGIRHLFWDTGYLFEIKNAYAAGWIVLCAAALLTGATWGSILKPRPAPHHVRQQQGQPAQAEAVKQEIPEDEKKNEPKKNESKKKSKNTDPAR